MKKCFCNSGRFILLATIAVFMLTSLMASATHYITFNDGHMLVFPSTSVKAMTQRDGVISFTAVDGKVYTYSLADIKTISQQSSPRDLPVFMSFKFQKKNNYQLAADATGVIEGDSINATVAGIGKRLTATFTLSDDAARAYVDGVEQHSTVSRLRFEADRVYTVGYPGDLVLVQTAAGDYAMMPYGREYTVKVDFLTDHSTTVPRIDINTVGGVNITSKEYYVDAEIIIDGAGVFPSMTDSVKIKGRGNSSWSNNPKAKNPYRLKFDNKVKPLGLAKGKSWVLLNNKHSGSMMTNAIGMKAASLIGTPAANHIIPVDLYINGTYKGSYNFTENVGFASNSVDIDDEGAATLLELDTHYDEDEGQKFMSNPMELPVNIKEPDFSADATVLTLDDVEQRFNGLAAAIFNNGNLADHADIDYLARYLMVNELICNRELLHPKSVFCYNENLLDDNSRFIFGPVWDLDWSFGFDGSSNKSYFNNNIYYDYYNEGTAVPNYQFLGNLGKDMTVRHRIYELWNDFITEGLDELCDFCKDYYKYAKPSLSKNTTVAGDYTNYSQQASWASTWIRTRADFIYNQLKLEFEMPGDVNSDQAITIDDVTMLIDYLMDPATQGVSAINADVNCDGFVDIEDLSTLIDLMLN